MAGSMPCAETIAWPVGKFLLSAEARKHVTVVLTGEGADEVFLGYRSFFANAIRDTREARRTSRSTSTQRRLKLSGLAGTAVQKLSLLIFRKDHRRRLQLARENGLMFAPDPGRPAPRSGATRVPTQSAGTR